MVAARRARRGNVCVFLAFCMIFIVGAAAVAIDGGLIMDDVQKLQAAADASAMAAATELFKNWQSDNGFDRSDQARDAALSLAATNGFSNDGTDSVITPNEVDDSGKPLHGIWCPPISGDHVGKPGYAEVVIQFNQKRNFSSIYGSDRIPVRARAVAQGSWQSVNAGIMLLDPSSSGSLTVTGNGTMTVANAPLIVDSSAADAITSTGGGSVTVASDEWIDVTGKPGVSGSGTVTGTINSGVPPTPDPLAYMPEPSSSGAATYNKVSVSGKKSATVSPGIYHNGISVSAQGSLTMNPGIYIMDGGGFSFTGQGNLTATGVMIVNRPNSNSDVININGTGAINISPMTTGLYRGISIWQDRNSTNTISVAGNGNTQIRGTFYAQHGMLNVTGNGSADVIGSQYISYDMKVNGGGAFNIDWNVNQVARVRILRLVE
jgi:hypothetical protein